MVSAMQTPIIMDGGIHTCFSRRFTRLSCISCPSAVFKHMHKPSVRTLNDRFRHLVKLRRGENKRDAAISEIVEKRGDTEELPDDDLVEEIYKKAEATRFQKNDKTEHEKRLVAAGESIREIALKHRSEHNSKEEEKSSVPRLCPGFKKEVCTKGGNRELRR